jgi:hypothetical protein
VGGGNSAKLQGADKIIMTLPPSGGFFIAMWALFDAYDKAIDFSFIYDEVKGMYGEMDWGKPGIDPVSLFKIVFIQYLFGIRSML